MIFLVKGLILRNMSKYACVNQDFVLNLQYYE